MQIPADFIDVKGRAVAFTDTVVVVIEHSTQSQTQNWMFDRETGQRTDWGMHRSPADAIRFARAYLAGTEDHHRRGWPYNSERYSAAVDRAYSREAVAASMGAR